MTPSSGALQVAPAVSADIARNRLLGLAPRMLESSPIHEASEAEAYEAMVNRHGWLLNKPFVDLINHRMRGRNTLRVLDVGTGPGWIPVALAASHPGWRIVGVDVSRDMLERARNKADKAGVGGRVTFRSCKPESLPMSDREGSFDLVISHFTLHHFDRPDVMLDECLRVTRPGGRLLLKDLLRQSFWKRSFLLAFSKYLLRYSALQLQMYRESMDAGLSLKEAEALGQESGWKDVSITRFRNLDFVVEGKKPPEARSGTRRSHAMAVPRSPS